MENDRHEPIAAGKDLETHSLFPSGEWEGFYTYEFGPDARRHTMSFTLTFKNGRVTGSGVDDIHPFSWHGNYDTEQLRCWMHKIYASHTVFYDGHVDENGIWGTWEIPPFSQGGFHLWPKGLSEDISLQDKLEVPDFFKIPEVITT